MNFRPFALAGVFAVSLLSVLIVPQPAMAQEDPVKIAVVNLDRVVAQSAAGIALNEKLATFQAEVKDEVEVQQARIVELREKISDGAASENQAQLVNLQKQFDEARGQLQRFRNDKNREAQQIRDEGLQEIEKQFQPVFVAIQDEFDYDLILNQNSGVVMMVGERLNITQMVIDRLK